MATPAIAQAALAKGGTGAIGSIVKAGTEVQREDIRERQKTTRQRYKRDVEFERFEKKLMERYLQVGQTSIQETRKSINDLSKPFYEVSWQKRGKFHKISYSPLIHLMIMAHHGVAYYGKKREEARYWYAKHTTAKNYSAAAAAKKEMELQNDKMHDYIDRTFADPWTNLVTNKADWLKDEAQQIIYPPPPEPALQHTTGRDRSIEDRNKRSRYADMPAMWWERLAQGGIP